MFDSEKQVTCGGNHYTVTSVCRYVWERFRAAFYRDAQGSEERAVEALYRFLPYFLSAANVGSDVMGLPVIANECGVPVRKASAAWIALNVPGTDLPDIRDAMIECNTLTEDEQAGFTGAADSPPKE